MPTNGLRWDEVTRQAGPLADAVLARLAAHEHHVMATVRDDGRPRVSGTNLFVTDGRLWLGMMAGSARRRDLESRPWCAVHSAPLNPTLPAGEGDVRLDADVVFLDEVDARRLLASTAPADAADETVPDGVVVELLVRSMDLVEVDGPVLSVTTWSPVRGVRVRRLS